METLYKILIKTYNKSNQDPMNSLIDQTPHQELQKETPTENQSQDKKPKIMLTKLN